MESAHWPEISLLYAALEAKKLASKISDREIDVIMKLRY